MGKRLAITRTFPKYTNYETNVLILNMLISEEYTLDNNILHCVPKSIPLDV